MVAITFSGLSILNLLIWLILYMILIKFIFCMIFIFVQQIQLVFSFISKLFLFWDLNYFLHSICLLVLDSDMKKQRYSIHTNVKHLSNMDIVVFFVFFLHVDYFHFFILVAFRKLWLMIVILIDCLLGFILI